MRIDPSLKQTGVTHRTAALRPDRVGALDRTGPLLTAHRLVHTGAGGAGV